jgi:hypothetical protein
MYVESSYKVKIIDIPAKPSVLFLFMLILAITSASPGYPTATEVG